MPRRVRDPELVKLAIDLYRKGLSVSDIADELRVSKSTVSRWLKKYREGKDIGDIIVAGEEKEVEAEEGGGGIGSRLVKEDVEYAKKFVNLKENPRIPILLKELRSMSWWHNLVHDVGVNAVLIALSTMDIPLDKLEDTLRQWKEDYSNLEEYILSWLSKSVELRKDVMRLMELEEENRILRAQLTLLQKMYARLYDAYSTIVTLLPTDLKQKMYIAILLKQTLGGGVLVQGKEGGA